VPRGHGRRDRGGCKDKLFSSHGKKQTKSTLSTTKTFQFLYWRFNSVVYRVHVMICLRGSDYCAFGLLFYSWRMIKSLIFISSSTTTCRTSGRLCLDMMRKKCAFLPVAYQRAIRLGPWGPNIFLACSKTSFFSFPSGWH
jgi:hypothetical protein